MDPKTTAMSKRKTKNALATRLHPTPGEHLAKNPRDRTGGN